MDIDWKAEADGWVDSLEPRWVRAHHEAARAMTSPEAISAYRRDTGLIDPASTVRPDGAVSIPPRVNARSRARRNGPRDVLEALGDHASERRRHGGCRNRDRLGIFLEDCRRGLDAGHPPNGR